MPMLLFLYILQTQLCLTLIQIHMSNYRLFEMSARLVCGNVQKQNRRRRLHRRFIFQYHHHMIQRRKSYTCAQMMFMTLSEYYNSLTRHIWVHPRHGIWWDEALLHFCDAQWKRHFRMRRSTFDYLVRCLEPYLTYEDTQMRRAIYHSRNALP